MTTLTDDSVVALYDEDKGIFGEDANASQPVKNPQYISIDGMDGSSEFAVQAKLHPDATWQDIDTVDITQPSAMIAMDNPPTLVRILRKTGSNKVIVYAKR